MGIIKSRRSDSRTWLYGVEIELGIEPEMVRPTYLAYDRVLYSNAHF